MNKTTTNFQIKRFQISTILHTLRVLNENINNEDLETLWFKYYGLLDEVYYNEFGEC